MTKTQNDSKESKEETKNPTQDELRDFVGREVLICQTSLVETLLEMENYELIQVDEIVNLYRACKECKGCEDGEECIYPQNEILEWWVVSDRLAENLEKQGEPVLKSDYGTWWGRTCSGQAIYMDNVIEDIYKSL